MESNADSPEPIASSHMTTGGLEPHTDPTDGTFGRFMSGVLDVQEHGQEVVVTTDVWTIEELVLTRHLTERVEVVRDTLRRVDIDVEDLGAPGRA